MSRQQNIFTGEQGAILGEIVMQQIGRDFKIVRDPGAQAYLQAITDRLAETAGAGKVQVEIVELPEVNAMTLPGGHVLVARKLAATVQSEDELAGIIAHELGHVVRHDSERDMSAMLRAALDVTSVGDRKDIEDKYNQFIETASRNTNKIASARRGGESEREQQVADQVAIWVMARSGYRPEAYAEAFDRIAEVQSKTGSWLSNLFGTTKPEEKRLRIARQAVEVFPASCVGTRAADTSRFAEWQQQIVEVSRGSRVAALHGVTGERKLEPPLRSDLSHLKFGAHGRWVLAQDDGSIYLYTRDPLAFQFRIDASDAYPAQFTPDGSAVVFYDENYRVSRWNLADRRREWVREVVVPTSGCLDSALSPDGEYLACTTLAGANFTLRLQQVSDGSLVFERRGFYSATLEDVFALLGIAAGDAAPGGDHFIQLEFSPDGHYLVAARRDRYVAFDLSTRAAFSLPGAIRDRIGASFSFLGGDRLVGINRSKTTDSAVVTFPEGQVVSKLKLGDQLVTAATRGERYVMLHGVSSTRVAVYDAEQDKVVLGTQMPGLDLYDNYFLMERKDGRLGIYTISGIEEISTAPVPAGPLGRLRAAAVSPDLATLAISETSRGGLWDLRDGRCRMVVRGFRGVHIEAGQQVYTDFPREGKSQRAVVKLDGASRQATPLVAIEPPLPTKGAKTQQEKGQLVVSATVTASNVAQYGRYLVGRTQDNDKDVLNVYEATSGKELWSRSLPKGWPATVRADERHETLLLGWVYTSDGARAMVDANPSLKKQFDGLHVKKEDVGLNEMVDLATGKTRGFLLVDFGGGSFRFRSFASAGDHVVFNDTINRTLAYSLSTGQQAGHAFGTPLDVADSGTRVAVQNGAGEVTIYSLPGMQPLDELVFPSEVAFARFINGAARLFVLTVDQTAYTLEVGPATR